MRKYSAEIKLSRRCREDLLADVQAVDELLVKRESARNSRHVNNVLDAAQRILDREAA